MSLFPTRRQFSKIAVTAVASAATGPLFLHASDKSGSRRARVGNGEHTYECIHDWGMDALPDGHDYGNASHGIAIDSQGHIYITHYGNPGSIFVFDAEGKFVKSMSQYHRAAADDTTDEHGAGHGIDIRNENGEDFLYLSPNNRSLFFAKVNLKGELVWKRGLEEIHQDSGKYNAEKPLFRPTNASFRPDGGYYLGDGYGSNYLFHYDRNDRYVRTIGGTGNEDGKFQTPHGQWLDDRDGTPKLVVADRANQRLQWFDMAGEHLKTQDGFLLPADIDIQGDLMVVPDLHARVTLLDKRNHVISHLGDDENWRQRVLADNFKMRSQRPLWQPGKFIHPHDACFDVDGNIFVTEWVKTGRVTKLVKVG